MADLVAMVVQVVLEALEEAWHRAEPLEPEGMPGLVAMVVRAALVAMATMG